MINWHRDRFVERESCVRQECQNCSRPYWLPPSKAPLYLTCGVECRKAINAAAREARRRECACCGASFYPRTTQLRDGGGRFCSNACCTKVISPGPKPQRRKPEEVKRANRAAAARRRRLANPERHAAVTKAWQQKNRERCLANNRAFRARNPDRVRAYEQTRRARHNNAEGKFTASDIQRLRILQRGRCAICGAKDKTLSIDHIIPLVAGGSNWPANLQLLCISCNSQKSAKDPVRFMQERGFLL